MAPRKRKAAASSTSGASASAEPAVDYSKLTVAQLRSECEKSGLDSKGKKQELIDRLNENADDAPPAKLQKQSTIQRAMEVVKKSAGKSSAKKTHKVDQYCYLGNAEVYKDYDCMLNQTNIGNNNNKYYVIQVLSDGKSFYAWNRWGRVGESGANAMKGPFTSADDAVNSFSQKFKDKTKNDWANRSKFAPVAGKYTLLEMGDEDEEETTSPAVAMTKDGKAIPTKPSQLDTATQQFVKLIFDNDMFKDALIKMEIDIKKMPLGKLSKTQIVKGFEVLDNLKKALDSKAKNAKLTELSNQFYTVIPHDFGRQRPPIISDQTQLRNKLDMLITLSDIQMAQDMLQSKSAAKKGATDLPSHPLDENYALLKCGLDLVKKNDKEFKVIKNYVDATGATSWRNLQLLDVWKVDREGGARFKAFDKIPNRKLLWHGTNVAVVAAILKSGLRIMPHSGGRVGRGIYLASENSKSAGYVGTASDGTGVMFLAEAALGKEHGILRDNGSLTAPPKGYDSVVARGITEPDPKQDATLTIDGHKVVVPQGKPITRSEFNGSYFSQSEYLVYHESQVRIRYVLKLKFH